MSTSDVLDQEDIDQQQQLLGIYRRNLVILCKQTARYDGESGVPLSIANEIYEARENIKRIKEDLRVHGVDIADEPNDQACPPAGTEARNRDRMLERVRNFWIKGVLENSLYGATLIQLGIEDKPEAVAYSWELRMQHLPPRALSPDTKIIDLFDESGGELLILGVPGAGKTTLLLTLGRDLIERAEQDESHPMPVVFNLASWAYRRLPLTEWMVDELSIRYHIPVKVGKAWVETDQVLPLLDGLDEVRKDQRDACVEAINQFRQEHGLTNIVVCSRIEEYDELSTRLDLASAVQVRLLTQQQISQYLAGMGPELAAVRAAIERDATFYDLMRTPLMLSIAAIAYRELPIEALVPLDSLEPRKQYKPLFDAYVQRVFAPEVAARRVSKGASKRRSEKQHYDVEQTIARLTWLAQNMKRHSQSEFLIERLQPSWLLGDKQQWMFIVGVSLAAALLFALIAGLGRWLPFALALALIWRISGVRTFGLTLLLSLILIFVERGVGIDRMLHLPYWGAAALTFGLAGGLVIGIQSYRQTRRRNAKMPASSINIVEQLNWSWVQAARGTGGGFILGLIIALPFIALIILTGSSDLHTEIFTLDTWIGLWFGAGLGIGVPFALTLGLVQGLTYKAFVEQQERIVPNQGIRSSARNAALAGLAAVIGTFFTVLFIRTTSQVSAMSINILPVALMVSTFHNVLSNLLPPFYNDPLIGLSIGFGLVWALGYGGFACIQHGVLRLLLKYTGLMPWNCAQFLDYASDRLLMRKVGGGYIFIHRLLLEHFAALKVREDPHS